MSNAMPDAPKLPCNNVTAMNSPAGANMNTLGTTEVLALPAIQNADTAANFAAKNS